MKPPAQSISTSVVICTHNPKPVLQRALAALRDQTADLSTTELIIVDNASPVPVQGRFDTGWHPNVRHVIETRLGTTFARVRGMREAKGDLLLFVDDDNLLAPDYLELGLRLAREWPMIGCFGGQLLPEFESEPPAWTQVYWRHLAIRPLERDLWTNVANQFEIVPPTAGMFVRRLVFEKYLHYFDHDERHAMLGPRGEDQKMRCEDFDLAFTACDIGLGMALFKDLRLTHVMPSGRFTVAHLTDVLEGAVYSTWLLRSLRERVQFPKTHWLDETIYRWRERRLPSHLRALSEAERRGFNRAREVLESQRASQTNQPHAT